MSELKPCPFCGKFGIHVLSDGQMSDGATYWASCCDDHCMSMDTFVSVETWNTRPGEMTAAQNVISSYAPVMDALTAERDQLRAKNMNYAINVCPEQDRIITELRSEIERHEQIAKNAIIGLTQLKTSLHSERAASEEEINNLAETIDKLSGELIEARYYIKDLEDKLLKHVGLSR